jgi:uncharacterized repeat protein (TIGR01451 family)
MIRMLALIVLGLGQAVPAAEPPTAAAPALADPQPGDPAQLPPLPPTSGKADPPQPWAEDPLHNPPGSPPGRQDSLVVVDWTGPALAQVGQKADYAVLTRNTSPRAIHKVVVYVKPAAGMVVATTTPKADTANGILVWQLGTLLPRQEKRLKMEFVIKTRGEVTPQAWVSFTGVSSAALHIQVREPRLALKVAGPARVVAGDPANFQLTVSNTGDCLAGQVKVRVKLPPGLEHARGKEVTFDIGDLSAGEARTLQMSCIARAGGEQRCEVVAESGGCARSRDAVTVNVIVPTLAVELTGPVLRYVERKATFTLGVTNRGQVSASNVSVVEAIPAGFKFVSAAEGGRFSAPTSSISWFLGELATGQARQVHFELQAVKAGQHRHRATALSDRGCIEVSRELVTRVEDFSALALEIAHADDAIEVGKDTVYEVLVSNSGSRMETDVKLTCALPRNMNFRSAQGPTRFHREGSVIVFEPLPKLAARGDVVYKVKVRALEPGDVRFKVQVTSTNLVEPVSKSEATRIYSDRP